MAAWFQVAAGLLVCGGATTSGADTGSTALDADQDGVPIDQDCDDTGPDSSVVATDSDRDGTPTAADCDGAGPEKRCWPKSKPEARV